MAKHGLINLHPAVQWGIAVREEQQEEHDRKMIADLTEDIKAQIKEYETPGKIHPFTDGACTHYYDYLPEDLINKHHRAYRAMIERFWGIDSYVQWYHTLPL